MFKALEFYSGIGGLHLASTRAKLDTAIQIIRAFDWDPAASEVYTHNFGKGVVERCDISNLTASDLLPYNADVWLLSPACQPYTVLNPNAKGEADPRAKSFLNLMTVILPELAAQNKEPDYIFVENVAGFENSTTRQTIYAKLQSLRYNVSEFLLTPLQFGIPNSRLRYYALARKEPFDSIPPYCSDQLPNPKRSLPNEGLDWVDPRLLSDSLLPNAPPILSLQSFLDDENSTTLSQYSIPPKILQSKHAPLFDIVKPSYTRTCCFTRGYTHMIEGSSILQQNEELDTTDTFNAYATAVASRSPNNDNDPLALLSSLRLRYFTPTELLRLLCFNPPLFLPTSSSDDFENLCSYGMHLNSSPLNLGAGREFTFPDTISLKTRYRLIGNSVNVFVVSKLISFLLTPMQT